jgi:hypothetical protein
MHGPYHYVSVTHHLPILAGSGMQSTDSQPDLGNEYVDRMKNKSKKANNVQEINMRTN